MGANQSKPCKPVHILSDDAQINFLRQITSNNQCIQAVIDLEKIDSGNYLLSLCGKEIQAMFKNLK